MNIITRALTGAALATVATFAVAELAGAASPTVEDTRAAGCNPIFSLRAGTNVIRYGAGGQAGCAGRTATLVYDRTDGSPVEAVTFDLGAGSVTVDPARACGQLDAFNGDVVATVNGPGFRPAHVLWTAATSAHGLPACQPVEVATTTTAAPPPPSTSTTVEAPPVVTTWATTPAPEATVPPAVELTSTVQLPVTGRPSKPIAAVGLGLLLIGAALVWGFERRTTS